MAAIAQTHADFNARIQALKPQITREVQKAESRSDRPKPGLAKAQIQLRQYRQFWEQVNPNLAAVLGEWGGPWGYSITVFPTNQPNQVCVQYVDESEATVEVGTLKDKIVIWKSPSSGITAELLRERNSLVFLRLDQNPPVINPQPISTLPRPVSKLTAQRTYESLGCITETDVGVLPKK